MKLAYSLKPCSIDLVKIKAPKTYKMRLLLYLIPFLLPFSVTAQSNPCLSGQIAQNYSFKVDSITIPIDNSQLFAYLYVPTSSEKMPAAIVMHGGGNNYTRLMDVPIYFARKAAACGIVTLIYDKRGTGRSTISYPKSDFNDFVQDASTAIDYLNSHPKVDTTKIAAFGVSQGGRLVGVLAARNRKVDMIANVSGPINSVVQTRKFSTLNGIRGSNAPQELINSIITYWERHFDLLEENDSEGLTMLDEEIRELRNEYNPNWLPPLSEELGNHPIENSYGLSFFDEYVTVGIPWLNLYGENDQAVDAKTSAQNLRMIQEASGNELIEITVLPNSTHGLYDTVLEKQFPFEEEVIKWILSISPRK